MPLAGQVERAVADWLGEEAALLFPSGYQVNTGLPQALLQLLTRCVSDLLEVERLDQLVVQVALDLRELDVPAASGTTTTTRSTAPETPLRTADTIDQPSATHSPTSDRRSR